LADVIVMLCEILSLGDESDAGEGLESILIVVFPGCIIVLIECVLRISVRQFNF